MIAGFDLFNRGDYDALREFFAPDVVMERVGDLPPIHGWEAFRAFQEPDAFEWQRLHPLDWEINHDKVLVHLRIESKGAASGLELAIDGWMVWTVVDHVVAHIGTFQDEAEARAAAGLHRTQSAP
jgi:ketosteroid isomerase-like protein